MQRSRHLRASLVGVLFALALVVACGEQPTEPPRGEPVALRISASLLSTTVTMVVVEVTAPDITTPLIFNFAVTGGTMTGSMTIPAGSSRTITAHAYDSGGTETHRGSVTMNIGPGAQQNLSLTLVPLTADQPITITVSSIVVTVTPSSSTITATTTVQLTAAITDANANPVAGTVRWATLNPGVATVDQTGLVTGVAAGTTQIVATFGGVGGSATVTVFTGTTAALSLITDALVNPTFLTAPAGDDRLFVVEQAGRIRILKNGVLLSTPFLDITSKVAAAGEEGMLSLAFHPQFAQNGYFYLTYTAPASGTTFDERLVRFGVSADPDVALPASETPVMTINNPSGGHNGGHVEFGPDGKLYWSVGDGGLSTGGASAQDLSSLLGKILRIDVDGAAPYSIPSDNPFVGRAGARAEIWEYGFRNPWRYSFDPATGNLIVADVGERTTEEIDLQRAATPAGRNFGWGIMEGSNCFGTTSCDQTGLTLPISEYAHSVGCSVIGGYVYRGGAIRELSGLYLYSDYCNGWVKSFRIVDGVATEQHDWSTQLGVGLYSVSSFGRDGHGEIYLLTRGTGNGRLYKFVPAS